MNDDILYEFYCIYFNEPEQVKYLYKKESMNTYRFHAFRLNYCGYELLKGIYAELPKFIKKFLKQPEFLSFGKI